MKSVFPWLIHWAYRAGTRDFCSALAALVSPAQKFDTILLHLSPSPSKVGRQSCRVAYLLISVSGSTPGYLSVERVSVHHDGGEVLGPGELGDPLLQVSYTHLQEPQCLSFCYFCRCEIERKRGVGNLHVIQTVDTIH
jgi:hypothetical protein